MIKEGLTNFVLSFDFSQNHVNSRFIMRPLIMLWVSVLITIYQNTYASHPSAGNPSDSIDIYTSSELNTNPFTGKTYFGTIKVNTLQVLFSEVPFSIEFFLRNDLSIQVQAGIIFPLERESFLEQFFRSSGVNATASDKGFISYRKSPYNNHGMSYKAELRRYRSGYYYAPQLMYKACRYDDAAFHIFRDNRVVEQTESKSTRILGLGVMAGRQTYFMKQATDWYVGIGMRARYITATVQSIRDPKETSAIVNPNESDSSFKIYPFINLGFRIGFTM